MTEKPSHIAYVVTDPKKGTDRKPIWYEVGSVWPHQSGNGFSLLIPPGMTVRGRIVCIEKREKKGP